MAYWRNEPAIFGRSVLDAEARRTPEMNVPRVMHSQHRPDQALVQTVTEGSVGSLAIPIDGPAGIFAEQIVGQLRVGLDRKSCTVKADQRAPPRIEQLCDDPIGRAVAAEAQLVDEPREFGVELHRTDRPERRRRVTAEANQAVAGRRGARHGIDPSGGDASTLAKPSPD